MSNHTSRHTDVDDDNRNMNKITSEGSDANQRTSLSSFQRPGPACSKRKSGKQSASNHSSCSPKPMAISPMSSPSLVRNAVENQPDPPYRSVHCGSQKMSVEDDVSNRCTPLSSMLEQPTPRTLSEFEKMYLIRLVNKHGLRTSPGSKNKMEKEKAWIAISNDFHLPVEVCKRKWQSLRERYCREKKRLADGGHISRETMEFLNEMNYSREKKPLTKRRTSPVIGSLKPMSIQIGSRSAPGLTPSHVQSSPHLEARNPSSVEDEKDPMISDTLFAKAIALQLQLYSLQKKNIIKSRIWQVFAEIASP